MATISEIQQNTEYKMKRTVETLEDHFKKLRTGRASTGLVKTSRSITTDLPHRSRRSVTSAFPMRAPLRFSLGIAR